MKVYKFGGASVNNADGIRNLAGIVSMERADLVIVVSAFGKTTNALEKVLKEWIAEDESYRNSLDAVYQYHSDVIEELFPYDYAVRSGFETLFDKLRIYLALNSRSEYDFEYDQVVSYGELWSTIIVAGYLKTVLPDVIWIDIRQNLLTDERFRDANIDWDKSKARVRSVFSFSKAKKYVTQGFIGGTVGGYTTTLGREGSDYTAAVLANMLDAESVTVWKDVPGILNADPKWLEDTIMLDEISYKEAVEMSFSGAKVIHPKTIKPLHNKNIPLYVRSFLSPGSEGTVIKAEPEIIMTVPVYVKKENQILISILPNDFSFVISDNLSRIFNICNEHGIKVNLVEASAVSLDVCIDDERQKVDAFIENLTGFSIVYNESVELLSIRHYNEEAIRRIITGREILLEQRTRSTVRFVVR